MEKPYLFIHDPQNKNWLHFTNPIDQIVACEHRDIKPGLCKAQDLTEKGYYVAGFLTYEASYAFEPKIPVYKNASLPLLWLGVFRNPDKILPGFDPQMKIPPLNWTPSLTKDMYFENFEKIKRYIRDGDTYQVNYTFDLETSCNNIDPGKYFENIIKTHPAPYAAYIDTGQDVFCSFSPELFFKRDGNTVLCCPMKGTAPRGRTFEEDQKNMHELFLSEKDRAENLMIVDMIRNDCGRIADTGSVEVLSLFDVEKYRTVYQLTSKIKAHADVSIFEIFNALFPCASISGAPKIRTAEIIYELEKRPRGIYCGSIGYMAPQKKALFNVAIRTVHFKTRKNKAVYSVGSGIVWDSQIDNEFEECIDKAKIVSQYLSQFDLIETILYTPQNGYFLFDEHCDRCSKSCLYFEFSTNLEMIKTYLYEIKKNLPQYKLKLRLVISKNGAISHTFESVSRQKNTIELGFAKNPVDSSNCYLYHKTTNRNVYRNAVNGSNGYDDVILWNERGEITETTIANLVIKKGNRYLTPVLECGLLPGTYRKRLLKQKTIEEAVIKIEDIFTCDEIWRINSVRKWQKCVLKNSQDINPDNIRCKFL